jgi:hypothetical protein
MFGIFARNFKMFKEQQSATDIDVILRKFFKSSQILDDVSSKNTTLILLEIILYFNLPFNPIVKERIEPVKIYPKGSNSGGGS